MAEKEQRVSYQAIALHGGDVIMSAMASQFTDVSIVCSTVCLGTDQRKHQSSASLAFVRRIHRWTVDSHHKGSVTRKMFPWMTSSCIVFNHLKQWNTPLDPRNICLFAFNTETFDYRPIRVNRLVKGTPAPAPEMHKLLTKTYRTFTPAQQQFTRI